MHYQRVGIGICGRCTLIAISAIRYRAIDIGSQMTFFLWTVITVICVIAVFDVIGSMYYLVISLIRTGDLVLVLRIVCFIILA